MAPARYVAFGPSVAPALLAGGPALALAMSFENGQPEKAGPSDGCRGSALPLAADSTYDFRERGASLGNVGQG